MDENRQNQYLVPLAIIIAGALVAGAVFYTKNFNPQPTSVEEIETEKTTTKNGSKVALNTAGEPYLGDPNAPVKIVYYGDFQCPFCKKFEFSILPIIKEKYLKTSQAVLYFKNFQFLGPDSILAGIAGECLINQLSGNFGPYWQWHEAMIKNQDAENSGWGRAQDIKNLVRELELEKQGINLTQFESCLDNQETLAEVQSDTQEGKSDGVTGTPASFINGQLVSGVQPISAFESIIEAELK